MSAGRTNAVGGVQLPELSNPAGAANIQSGYQAINGEGEVVTGTAVVSSSAAVEIYNTTEDNLSIQYGGVSNDGKINLWSSHGVNASQHVSINSFAGAIVVVWSNNSSHNISISGSNIREIIKNGRYCAAHILGTTIMQISEQ